MEKIYTGQAEKVLKDIGMEARNIVIDAFKTHGVDGEWKPLKEETINRKSVTRQTKKGVKIIKKGDAPLIDTGALRQSIAYKVILKKGI